MLYDYQYTVIAVFATAFLMVLVYQRKNYASKSNRVFMSLLYANLLASVTDAFTFLTISYPERYPMWLCYLSNIVYLWLFGLVAATFLRYIAVLVDEPKVVLIGNIEYAFSVGMELLLLVTTPLTRWIIYYDENLVYRHGVFMWTMYAIPVVLIANSLVMLLQRKQQFTRLQHITAVTVFLVAVAASVLQISLPRADMFHMMIVLVLFAVYIVFENPAYYTYHATRCLNSHAFYAEAKRLDATGADPQVLFVNVMNRPRTQGIHEERRFSRLMDEVADTLRGGFGRSVFCLADRRFVLLLKNRPGAEDAAVQKLAELFRAPLNVYGEDTRIEIRVRSMAFHTLKISDDYIDHLIECVQMTPPDRIASAPDFPQMLREQHEYREVEDALTRALEKNSFTVVYQPIYNLNERAYTSAEALVRMEDEVLGCLRPDVFIPAAEKNGSIGRIGEFVLKQACEYAASPEFEESGLQTVSVNLSPQQLLREGTGLRCLEIMRGFGTDPGRIVLEITESSPDLSDKTVQRNLDVLQAAGIRFALDDYGSGFASADYLFRLPVSYAKIDRSILVQAMEKPQAMLVLRDTVALMKKLNKTVIVEGAETADMVREIAAAGGDCIQGYYYAKPMPLPQLEAFLHAAAEGAPPENAMA